MWVHCVRVVVCRFTVEQYKVQQGTRRHFYRHAVLKPSAEYDESSSMASVPHEAPGDTQGIVVFFLYTSLIQDVSRATIRMNSFS